MIVKVKETYAGTFGCFDDKLHTVHAKRAGDPPFSVPDKVAEKKITEGVLVPVSKKVPTSVETETPVGEAKKRRRK